MYGVPHVKSGGESLFIDSADSGAEATSRQHILIAFGWCSRFAEHGISALNPRPYPVSSSEDHNSRRHLTMYDSQDSERSTDLWPNTHPL